MVPKVQIAIRSPAPFYRGAERAEQAGSEPMASPPLPPRSHSRRPAVLRSPFFPLPTPTTSPTSQRFPAPRVSCRSEAPPPTHAAPFAF